MINLILLTGFLGSGKTTLMQRTLIAFSDKKTGVIVNEFGSINIDAQLIKKDGIQIAELTNGSIFCACIKDKFVDSLIEMAGRPIDYLFIEASGLADPSNMETILKGIVHKTGEAYDYKGSVCIVDSENFTGLVEMLPAIGSQLEYCGAVILNKTDLADKALIKETRNKILEYNSTAEIYETSYCDVDIRKIIERLGNRAQSPEPKETSNTNANRVNTFVINGEKEVPLINLKKFIDDVIGDSYRIKGFVKTDHGVMEVSTVGKNINISKWDDDYEKSQLVIISAVGFGMMSTITAALAEHLKGIMSI